LEFDNSRSRFHKPSAAPAPIQSFPPPPRLPGWSAVRNQPGAFSFQLAATALVAVERRVRNHLTNRRSSPTSGAGAWSLTKRHSGYEPALHPGKRGGGVLLWLQPEKLAS